jgi:hypothetical protein
VFASLCILIGSSFSVMIMSLSTGYIKRGTPI